MDTKKLRQKILDLAIRGKLVPQDPNDEPASVLLERIRAEKERLIKEGKIKRSKKSASDTPRYENEAPFEVPNNWIWAKGLDIFKPMKTTSPSGDTFKYIDIDAIDNKRNVITSVKLLNTKQAPSRASRYTEKGCVLFSMVRPYLRNIAMVTEDDCIASTGFFVCQAESCLSPKFCYYLMLSNYVVDGLNNFMKGDNSPSITKGQIELFIFPLPPYNEQKHIVASIESWFHIIDILESDKLDLDEAIQKTKSKILDLAIHGKLVPQDPNDEPAIELLKRINPMFTPCDNAHYENIPFEIPQNWLWLNHNSILDISGGSQPAKSYFKSKEEKGYIRLYQIRDYGETPAPVYIPRELASKTTQKGDILLARYGGSLGKVFIAEEGAYNVAMAKVIFKYNGLINKEYAYFYYLSSLYQDKLKSISRTAQAGFNSTDFEDMFFPLPPIAEQERIVTTINQYYRILDNISANL